MVPFSRIDMSTRKGKKLEGRKRQMERNGVPRRLEGLEESRRGTTLSTLSFIPHMRRHGQKATQVERGGDASRSPTSVGPMQKDRRKGKGRVKRTKVVPSHPGRGRKSLAFREA